MQELKTYSVVSPLKANGERHMPGDQIDLANAEAQELTALGLIALPETGEQTPQKPDEAAQLQRVVDAIGDLDPDDTSHWLKSGKPDAKALTEHVGFEVPAELRDQAWQQVQEVQ